MNHSTDTSEINHEISSTPYSSLPRKLRELFDSSNLRFDTSPTDFSIIPLGEGVSDHPPQGVSAESQAGGGRGHMASPRSKLNHKKHSKPSRIVNESVTSGTETISNCLSSTYAEEWNEAVEKKIDILRQPNHISLFQHLRENLIMNSSVNPHLLSPSAEKQMKRHPYVQSVKNTLTHPKKPLLSATYPLTSPRIHPVFPPSNLLNNSTSLTDDEDKHHFNEAPSTSSTVDPPPVVTLPEKSKSCTKTFQRVESLLNQTDLNLETTDTSLTSMVPSEGRSIHENSDHLSASYPSCVVDIQNLHQPSQSKSKQINDDVIRESLIETSINEESRDDLSEAYERLRRILPSNSHDQESELSILKKTMSYIQILLNETGNDVGEGAVNLFSEE